MAHMDRLVIGNLDSGSLSYQSQDLVKRIASKETIALTEQIFLNTEPNILAVILFNYPIINNDCFKEFSLAVKKISLAKYTYYKKSSAFKEHFNKLLNDLFQKFHQVELKDQKDQIQKVNYAIPLAKYMGELYNIDYIENNKLKYYLENLVTASENSRISENCFQTLISITSEHAKNEAKQFHKHNYDVHTAAIKKIFAEYENSFEESKKNNKNYKDLEIIEAVNKINNKNGKLGKTLWKKNQSTTIKKNEVIHQTKKILETILIGSVSLSTCVQTAHDINLLFPDSFENEMIELCLEYLKKGLSNANDSNCLTIGKFIGKLYCADVFKSDTIKGTLSFLTKSEQSEQSKEILSSILNAIYDKIIENQDEVLKQFIPKDFVRVAIDGDMDESLNESLEEEESSKEKNCVNEEKKPVATTTSNKINSQQQQQPQSSVTVAMTFPNVMSPIDKFKNLLSKLSDTNIPYILREISQIQFLNGEENINDLAISLVDHALKKQKLINAFVKICVKLPDTIVPHFNISLLKKHLKQEIANSVVGCSEDKIIGCSQLVKELHIAGIYDRFDVISLLEKFTSNFGTDRTALNSLLKFTDELKDVFNNKKLSKNMSAKFKRIGECLKTQMENDNYMDCKPSIELAIKFYNGEYKSQANGHYSNNNQDEEEEEEAEIVNRESQLKLPGNFVLNFSTRKVSPVDESFTVAATPPLQPPPPPPVVEIVNVPPINRSPNLSVASESPSFNIEDNLHAEGLYSRILGCGRPTASVGSSDSIADEDQFFDTHSNHENSEKKSEEHAFKMLEETTRDNISAVQLLIGEQFSSNDFSMFVPTMLLLGTKFQNIDNFMKFVSVVEEALKAKGNQAIESFKPCLQAKIQDFFYNMWSKPQNDRNKLEIVRFIIMIGAFYNKGFLHDQFFLNFLQNFWNEIENIFQAKLFTRLITICSKQIIQNGIAKLCKEYLDNLVKYIHSFGEPRELATLTNEICESMKILTKLNKEAKKEEIVSPTKFLKNFLHILNAENFNTIIHQLKTIFPIKKSEMLEFVDDYIQISLISSQPSVYVKFAEKIRNAPTSDVPNFTFKFHLEEKFKEEIIKCLDDERKSELNAFKMIFYVGDLFLNNVVTIQLLRDTFEALFEREVKSKKIVDIIGMLMKKIGSKMDAENEKILDKFFTYFCLITANEDSYRTTIYKKLIELRKRKWMIDQTDAFVEIEEILNNLRWQDIVFFTTFVGNKIQSPESVNTFINLLWKAILRNPQTEMIYKYARLVQGLVILNTNFKNFFMAFFKRRNETFCKIPLQNISPDISKKLAVVIHFMCYLYVIDVASGEDIEIWIRPGLVQHLSITQNAEISIALGPKIAECTNVNVNAFFTFVEFNIKDQFSLCFNEIKNTLKDVFMP